MKEIIVTAQEQLDEIKTIEINERVVINKELSLKKNIEVLGTLIIKCNIQYNNTYFYSSDNSQPHIEAWGNSQPHIEAQGNSQPHIKAWDNSQPHIEAWGNSRPHIEAQGNSQPHIKAWDNSQPHIEAWGNSQPHIEAWDNSQPHIEAQGNSQPHIEAWGNSQPHIEAWDNSQIMGINIQNSNCKVVLNAFSILTISDKLKLKIKKSKTAIIQRVKVLDFFSRHKLNKKNKNFILYKKVSKDFKTQEGQEWETLWKIGTTLVHPKWNPFELECGGGKFHACPKPFFCNEFRNKIGDKYIAISVNKKDLYEWKNNPQFPHKIGFRKGKVLYEVNIKGEKI